MKLKLNKTITICYVITLLLFFSLYESDLSSANVERPLQEDFLEHPLTSQSWNLGPIIISESGGGNGTWAWAVLQDWCSGSGTAFDPYIIENVTIDCGGVFGSSGITIIDSTANFIIQDCTLINSGSDATDAGIKFLNTDNGVLRRNNLSHNLRNGIYFEASNENQILENEIHDNLNHGIHLYDSCEDNNISENIIDDNDGLGVRIESNSYNNTITKNDVLNNDWDGIMVVSNSDDCLIQENDIFNNTEAGISISSNTDSISIIENYFEQNGLSTSDPAIYAVGGNDLNISENTFLNHITGIHLRFVSNSEILNNQIYDTITSVYVEFYSDDNDIINNYILNSVKGIQLFDGCTNNEIIDNTIIKQSSRAIEIQRDCHSTIIQNNLLLNNYYGIYILDNSDNIEVSNNIIRDSGLYGLIISSGCENSLIFENYFIDNAIQVLNFETSSQWNSTSIGNFWSNYTGTDLNDDGIGDIPHPIISTANGFDYHPIFKTIPSIFIDEYTEYDWKWASFHYWINGSGTEEDPYIIQNKIINGDWQGTAIEIRNSNRYFSILNCTLSTQGAAFSGIIFNNVKNGKVENSTILNSKTGIEIFGSSEIEIISNKINFNDVGVHLSESQEINVLNNDIEQNYVGLYIYQSDYNYFESNSLLNTESCILEYESNNNLFVNNICEPEALKKLFIDIIEQIFTLETFNITLFVYNGTYIGIDTISITVYWNGTDVSSSISNIGNGYYFLSIEPIFTEPGELGITLECILTKSNYEQLIYSTDIAVDPESVDKSGGPTPPPGAIPWSITAIMLSTFLGIICLMYYSKRRVK